MQKLRHSISDIDARILGLFNERTELVKQVGQYKKERGLPIFDAVREKEILSHIPRIYQDIWDEIMTSSKRIQHSLIPSSHQSPRIAIQGGKGSFNEIALLNYIKLTGEPREIIYAYTTSEVLRMVADGEVKYGQFAIANSIGGLVEETLQSLGEKRFSYVTNYTIPIQHALMIHAGTRIEEIDTIMGHEQAIKQCEQTLSRDFSHMSHIGGTGNLTDNASIAEALGKGILPRTTACIGHVSLSDIYGLKIVQKNIQDRSDNRTTFVLIRSHL